MNFDISPLLNEWEYQPGQIGVRQFKGKDGIQKIQLRVDLGVLQLNAHGRPDGKTPYGYESLLEYFEARLAKYRKGHAGEDEGFELTAEECSRLQQEAIQYHHRYICLFQLQDYAGVVRDTKRNLKVFDLVENYAASEELAWSLQQFRPQVLMMLARARGSTAIDTGDYSEAIGAVKNGLEQLREFYQQHNRLEMLEQSGEVQSLEVWLKELQAKRPLTKREKLEFALSEAIRREDYEEAAKVRGLTPQLANLEIGAMSLLARIQQEMKRAMLHKEADRLSTLRLLKSAIGYAQIERKTENLSDSEIVALVQKEIKKRHDSVEQFEKGGRRELAEKERRELMVLETFLPQQLPAEELDQLVRATIQELGATTRKDMGPVIKAVQAKAAGRADGKTISAVVGKLLT